MVIDFSKINFKERQTLVLRNLDGTAIQALGFAFNIAPSIRYNEVSEITFDYPAMVDGVQTPHYDDLVGMRIIDWVDIGQFILMSPSESSDGIRKIKSCKAYSLEYEFTYKKLSLDNSTYNFYSPLDNSDTIIGIILEKMPSWSVGTISASLAGKYRTFEVTDTNIYNFIKDTVQKSYNCIFDFDTYQRKINVRDANSIPTTDGVFLSHSNLAKSIQVDEDTENIFNCLDVNGAEGVNIRSVNPLGTNKIYNLDYFMTSSYFNQGMIAKWNSWKTAYDNAKMPFYILNIDSDLQIARLDAETAKLTDLNGELTAIDATRSTYIQYLAQHPNDETAQDNLDVCNTKYLAKESEIAAQKSLVAEIQSLVDSVAAQLQNLSASVAFSEFFTEEELKLLDRHIKEDSISESSFVATTSTSYASTGDSHTTTSLPITLTGSQITAYDDATSTKKIYSLSGGSLSMSNSDLTATAEIISAAFEDYLDGRYIFSAYLKNCVCGDMEYPTASMTGSGTATNIVSDCAPDPELHGDSDIGTQLSFTHAIGNLYLTRQCTDYAQHSIEFDLMEYGEETLAKLSRPSYTFSVDSANFLAAEDFEAFKNAITLGNRIYVDAGRSVLQPIFIGVDCSIEDPSSLTLMFSDKFNSSESAFQLVDLLEQSISMGKTVDFSKYTYREFIDSGAKSSVEIFMTSALDVAKNAVMSAGENGQQNMVWNQAGLSLTKAEQDGSVSPNQIRIINNCIVFTSDGWQTAQMAIGQFEDSNTGSVWGVVAPSIVGTILAGESLVIESKKQDGGIAVFKVDADGARLYNSKFELVSQYTASDGLSYNGQIGLIPSIGIVAGNVSGSNSMYEYDETNGEIIGVKTNRGYAAAIDAMASNEAPNANFWTDMHGNVFLRGTVYATDGQFSGVVQASDFLDNAGNSMLVNGKFDSSYLDLGNIQLDGATGDITMSGNINLSQGNINWGSNSPVKYQFSVDGTSNWHELMADSDKYRRDSLDGGATWGNAYQFRGTNGSNANVPSYITKTCITETDIYSPTIYAGKLYATDGSNIYAEMNSDGFSIFDTNITEPKAQLASKNDGNAIWFSLGAGSGQTSLSDRFVMLKTPSYTSMYLYGDTPCGFLFRNDGTIEVEGTLEGAVAVFG